MPARRYQTPKPIAELAANDCVSARSIIAGGNGTHYINHSCEPNAFMKITYGHILFIALRDIEPGEEITIDYESTLHSNKKRCICGAPSCRGTINNPKMNY
jgi:SET domain-containing protein